MMLDDETLSALRAKTLAGRAALGLDADGRVPPAPATARVTADAAAADFAEALAARVPWSAREREQDPPWASPRPGEDVTGVPFPKVAMVEGKLVVEGTFACHGGCARELSFPGLCSGCAEQFERQARAEVAETRILERIPAEFQDASWAALPHLRNRTRTGPRVCVDTVLLPEMRRALERNFRAVIHGPNGSGKSTLAACWLRAGLELGLDGLFLPAVVLEDTDEGRAVFAQAVNAQRLVVDDLAGELFAAPPRGGVAAIRIRMVAKLLRQRFSAGRRTVITTEKRRAELEAIYTPAIVRRIFDGAADIALDDGVDDTES
jgi:hypothetical protein